MALDGNTQATIEFFTRVYPTLVSMKYVSIKAMAELNYMTPQGARKHVAVLESRGYLKRKHYRAWYLNDFMIKDPTLLNLLRLSNRDAANRNKA